MTNEQKQLLLKDLCARLPYGVKGKLRDSNYTAILKDIRYSCFYPLLVRPLECPLTNDECSLDVNEFKPYLRPMSSMTEEEYKSVSWEGCSHTYNYSLKSGFRFVEIKTFTLNILNWLNAHHFDYRGLIKNRLALEAPKDMYKTE